MGINNSAGNAMGVDLAIKVLDELVFAKMGHRLDHLQREILQGSWQGQKYLEIAEEANLTEGYVREVGAELWRILSAATGEEVNKSNFRSLPDRLNIKNSTLNHTFSDNTPAIGGNVGSLNLCPGLTPNTATVATTNNQWDSDARQSLTTKPDIKETIARKAELETLSQWVSQDECRLIGLWGLPNVGKSVLAAQLIDCVAEKFSAAIWRDLNPETDPDRLAGELADLLSQGGPLQLATTASQPLSHLFDRLRAERCLLVLNNLDTAFVDGTWAGTWRTDLSTLTRWVDQAARCRHPSCIIVTSREPPINWNRLEEKYQHTRSLTLSGLDLADGLALLRLQNLSPTEAFPELVNRYRGHAGWLVAVAKATHTWFKGNAAEFVSFGGLLPEGVLADLTQLGDRLAPAERQTLSFLAQQSSPIPIPALRQALNFTPTDSLALLESLMRRSLLETDKFGETITVSLSPTLAAWSANLGR